MMRQFLLILSMALFFPYVVTLFWTGNTYIVQAAGPDAVMEAVKENEAAAVTASATGKSQRKILLDRGEVHTYMDLESYLEGVLAKQLMFLEGREYRPEAWKAQAIIARTYLYRIMGDEYEIPESALDIDYLDETDMKKLWEQDRAGVYFERIHKAASETKGLVMQIDNACILPLFHQVSTGVTRKGENIYSYIQSVTCNADPLADGYQQSILIGKEEAAKRISSIADAVPVSASVLPAEIQIIARDEGGYVARIQIGGKEYSGEQIQAALGLPSASFAVEDSGTDLRITVKGSGHGYGLSQNEANAKAGDGWSAEDILVYFYQGINFYNE